MDKQSYESLIEQDIDKFIAALMPHGGGATITEQRLRLHLKTLVQQVASHAKAYELMNLMDTSEIAEAWGVSRRRVIAHVTMLNQRWGVGRKIGRDWLLTADEVERYKPTTGGRPRKEK